MLEKPTGDRRTVRREATKAEILDAAWEIARTEGLAAITLRDVARRVGMQAPSLYQYFDSKNAIYDAMFAQGQRQYLEIVRAKELPKDRRGKFLQMTRDFVEFSTSDPARYQLMFQRTVPGFEPSEEAYALAVEVLDQFQRELSAMGFGDPSQTDIITAVFTGLTDQQISNDPGGDRWIRLVDDAVDMLLAHLEKTTRRRK